MLKVNRLVALAPLVLTGMLASISSSATVLFSDGFESGGTSYTQNGIKWVDKASVSVVSGQAKSGSYAAKFHFTGSTDLAADAWSELRFSLGALRKEIWIKYDLYVPANYYHRVPTGSGNNKGYIMLWSGDYTNNPSQLSAISFWPDANGSSMMCANFKSNGSPSTHKCNQNDISGNIAVTATTKVIALDPSKSNGKWETTVIHIKAADVGVANGIYEVWKNGTKIWATLNVPNYATTEAANGFEQGYILGWANSGFNQDTDFYVDNVVFGTTGADVGISGSTAVSTTSAPSAPSLQVTPQ